MRTTNARARLAESLPAIYAIVHSWVGQYQPGARRALIAFQNHDRLLVRLSAVWWRKRGAQARRFARALYRDYLDFVSRLIDSAEHRWPLIHERSLALFVTSQRAVARTAIWSRETMFRLLVLAAALWSRADWRRHVASRMQWATTIAGSRLGALWTSLWGLAQKQLELRVATIVAAMIVATLWPLSLVFVATVNDDGTVETRQASEQAVVELASLGARPPLEVIHTDADSELTVFAAALQAVVRVSSDVSAGSGVIIDQSGLVLTAAHIFDDKLSVRVNVNGDSLRGQIVLIDRQRDLALVRIPAGSYSWAPLREAPTIAPGEPVKVVGYPLNLAGPATVTGGIVSRVFEEVGSSRQIIQTDAAINIGNSGGPMLDAQGRVVGIVSSILGEYHSTSTNGISFAVSSKTIAEKFLR